MNKLITIHFAFLEDIYYFMAHYKIKDHLGDYPITLMDDELEILMIGNHMIKERNGYLQIKVPENNEQGRLKIKIAEALCEFLNVPLTTIEKLVA